MCTTWGGDIGGTVPDLGECWHRIPCNWPTPSPSSIKLVRPPIKNRGSKIVPRTRVRLGGGTFLFPRDDRCAGNDGWTPPSWPSLLPRAGWQASPHATAPSGATQPYSVRCPQIALMSWARSVEGGMAQQLHRCIRGRTDGSIRLGWRSTWRFDLAPHLGASLLWCTGFSLISVFAPRRPRPDRFFTAPLLARCHRPVY